MKTEQRLPGSGTVKKKSYQHSGRTWFEREIYPNFCPGASCRFGVPRASAPMKGRVFLQSHFYVGPQPFFWEGSSAYPRQTRMVSAPIWIKRIRMWNLWVIRDATLTVPFFGNWRAKKMTKMEMAIPESRAAAKTSVCHISAVRICNDDTKTYNYTWSTMRNGACISQIRDGLRGEIDSLPSNNILKDESNTTLTVFSIMSDCEVYKTKTYAQGT